MVLFLLRYFQIYYSITVIQLTEGKKFNKLIKNGSTTCNCEMGPGSHDIGPVGMACNYECQVLLEVSPVVFAGVFVTRSDFNLGREESRMLTGKELAKTLKEIVTLKFLFKQLVVFCFKFLCSERDTGPFKNGKWENSATHDKL